MEDKKTDISMLREFEDVVMEAKKIHQSYGIPIRTDDLVMDTLKQVQKSTEIQTENN